MADITITEGDTLEVDYNLENTGDGSGTFDPRLLVQGVQEDQDTGITLDPAQTATGTLAWPTESGDAVTDALAEAVTDDTSDSITVTVEDAIPVSVVDDFEDNDLSEWSNTGNVNITDSTVLEGQYSLQITSSLNAAGNRPYSLPGEELDYYPQKGDKFSALLWEGSSGNDELSGFCFGVATNTNGIDGYAVFHQPTFDEFGIQRIDDGDVTFLKNPSATLSTDQTYEYEVQWHDGGGSEPEDTIELTIYETDGSANLSDELGRSSQVVNTTVSDATYPSNRGVGISNASGSINGENRVDRYWHLGDVE